MPWQQRKREPAPAYARFTAYLQLGPERSLKQIASTEGVSVARLKQLSSQWGWPVRAAAWDRHRFLIRRGEQVEQAREAHQRLLKESADWQHLARRQFTLWVRRGSDGELRLTRELTPHEALRLWRAGCEAELVLREVAAAHSPADRPSQSPTEGAVREMSDALDEAARELTPPGADYRCQEEVREALHQLLLTWLYISDHVEEYGTHERVAHALWPWHLPFEQV